MAFALFQLNYALISLEKFSNFDNFQCNTIRITKLFKIKQILQKGKILNNGIILNRKLPTIFSKEIILY